MTSRTLSQTVDFLGFLRGQLSGLQGIATMCYELIQNADDVKDEQGNPATTRITFDFHDDALWVENDGIFREKDFERMRRISWGDKSREADTTGAFGIGFISVYQITDAPEVFSSGRHWTFHPEAEENNRIIEERMETEWTRFRLPWAFEENEVRRELGVPPVPQNAIDVYALEAARAVEEAALFLRQLELLEVKRNGRVLLKRVELLREGNTFILETGDSTQIWRVLQGDFAGAADDMRRDYGGLLENRKTKIQIAIPEKPSNAGRLFAFLPSETFTDLPFHINADFFPSPDRKRILLDQDYKSKWNRLALRCAVETLRRDAAELLTLFDDRRRLWAFLQYVKEADDSGPLADEKLNFWEAVAQPLAEEPIILTSRNENLKPSQVHYPRQEVQVQAAEIFEELGLSIVHKDLRPFQNLITSTEIGVPFLKLSDVVDRLKQAGFPASSEITSMPECLRTDEQWQIFWKALDSLSSGEASVKSSLGRYTIAFGSDGALHAPAKLYRCENSQVKELFSRIDPQIIWLDPRGKKAGLPYTIVPEFGLEEGLAVLERMKDSLSLRLTEEVELADLLDWLAGFERDIKPSSEFRTRILALPIGPTADGAFKPLEKLYLAGGFEDPLQLADLLDASQVLGRKDFLRHCLGVKTLDFRSYVEDWIPKVWKDPSIDEEARIKLVRFLSENLSKLKSTPNSDSILRRLPLVLCHDGKFRLAKKTYFGAEEIQAVLGDRIPIVDDKLLTESEAVKDFYTWLGVEEDLRAEDVIEFLEELVDSPPDESRREQVEQVFGYLAKKWKIWEEKKKKQFDRLKQIQWLPGTKERSRWCQPNELYTVFQDYLFKSQGNFLAFSLSVQRQGSGFLSYLGVRNQPTIDLVVRYLLDCVEEGEVVNEQIYRFLNEKVDDLKETQVEALRKCACLYIKMKDGEQTYVKPSAVFFGDHPFGRYRVSLPPQFSQYRRFLERIGVKDKPDAWDVIAVLQEIACSDFARGNSTIWDNPEFDIVVQAWRFLSQALEEGEISSDVLRSELGSVKSIPNSTQRILCEPAFLFLEDRPGWVQKFKLIEHNIVDRIEGCLPAMEAAGVRRLSQAVITELAEYQPVSADTIDVAQRLRDREHLLRRVLAARDSRLSETDRKALEKLLDVEFHPAVILKVKRTIEVFKRTDECLDDERALWLHDANDEIDRLYFTITDGQPSWTSIARELAYAVSTEDDDRQLMLCLKTILSDPSVESVESEFDELGIPPLQVHESEPIASPEVASLGDESIPADEAETIQYDNKGAGMTPQPTSQASPNTPQDSRHHDGSAAGTAPSTMSTQPAKKPRRSLSRLVSYVVPKNGRNEADAGLAGVGSRLQEIGQKGVKLVLEYERQHGRQPEDMNEEMPNHPGYDVKSFDPATEETRYIEVKALTGNWDATNPARMTPTEFEAAQERGERYWLYIVERVESGAPQIHCIHDPAHNITQFCFDHGWMGLATAE